MTQFASEFPADLEWWASATLDTPAAQGSTCEMHNARAAGIDRDDDDPGTATDETIVGKYSEERSTTNDAGQTVTTLDFYEPNVFEGESIALHADDQLVAQIADCYRNPNQEGWYRWWGHANGTTDGNESGDYEEWNAYSAWYYV